MQTQITARHFEANPALRQHVADRLSRLERYYDGITEAHVILMKDGTAEATKTAEITLNVYRQQLTASDSAPSHEVAIDHCVERLRRQILRYKAKLRSTNKDLHK